MTPAMETAFTAASGGQASSAVLLTIAAIVILFAITWLAWACFQFFEGWRTGNSEFGHFAWYLIRGAMVISVLVYFVR
jgi:integrating conjugative element protein (TIGR03758 family)